MAVEIPDNWQFAERQDLIEKKATIFVAESNGYLKADYPFNPDRNFTPFLEYEFDENGNPIARRSQDTKSNIHVLLQPDHPTNARTFRLSNSRPNFDVRNLDVALGSGYSMQRKILHQLAAVGYSNGHLSYITFGETFISFNRPNNTETVVEQTYLNNAEATAWGAARTKTPTTNDDINISTTALSLGYDSQVTLQPHPDDNNHVFLCLLKEPIYDIRYSVEGGIIAATQQHLASGVVKFITAPTHIDTNAVELQANMPSYYDLEKQALVLPWKKVAEMVTIEFGYTGPLEKLLSQGDPTFKPD